MRKSAFAFVLIGILVSSMCCCSVSGWRRFDARQHQLAEATTETLASLEPHHRHRVLHREPPAPL